MFFMWMIYDLSVKAYFNVIAERLLSITSICSIIKAIIDEQKEVVAKT